MTNHPLLGIDLADPYPFYKALRLSKPVAFHETLGGFLVARHGDVLRVLDDTETFTSTRQWETLLGPFAPIPETLPLVALDPPDHTALRRLANTAFTPRRLKAMEDQTTAVVDQLIDGVLARYGAMGQFDFVSELAGLVPVSVVCTILGIDVGRRRVLKHAVDGLFAAANRSVYPEERLNGLRQSTNTIRMCLDDTYDRYAREPADNLTSYLIQAEGDGDKLRRPDILNILLNILMGGTETTGNLIAAALIEMHREPEIAAKVQCGDLSLSAVLNEVLRFESPAQMLWRHATGNTTIADVAIPGGSLVFPMIASANRDESVFRDPDRFDPERGREGEMIAFGRGPHFCIGFRLALMEARVTLSRVFARLGRLAPVDSQIERVDSFFTRGIARLPVSFDARAVRPKRLSHAQ